MFSRKRKYRLKKALYKLVTRKNGEVVYLIIKNKCIFSGITWPGSTINYAEDIIKVILEQERLNLGSIKFYDLQTHLGYSRKEPGEFDFDYLKLDIRKDTFYVSAWATEKCPDGIKEIFRDFIGTKSSTKKT